MFFLAHAIVSVSSVCCLVPMAVFVGLIPVTLSGIGTRDVALLYFVPGLLGVPFMSQYLENNTKALSQSLQS